MTDKEKLAKNIRIREKSKETKQKRKSQVCRVYRVKIDFSHLNEAQRVRLKMLFVEAKWLYNDILTFINNHDINDYDSKTLTVQGLDKDRQPITHELQYISSQMRQSVIQGFKERIRIRGANQFWNIPDLEFANAKLLNLPDGYYLAITTYQSKGGEKKKYKPEIGIDMGIKTTITTSDGRKYKVLIEESERIKKCQRLIARRKKGSSNAQARPCRGRYKARKLLQRAYRYFIPPLRCQKLTSRKKDIANKIVHELLEHEHVYMADRVYECECGYRENRDIHAARNMILLGRKNTCWTQETFNPAFGENVQRTQACKPLAEHRGAVSLNYCVCYATGSPLFCKRG